MNILNWLKYLFYYLTNLQKNYRISYNKCITEKTLFFGEKEISVIIL